MARPLDTAKRAELLSGVVAYIGEHGLTDLSLRPLAAALGTSSRMLIHYFGTKEEMLTQALLSRTPDIVAVFAEVRDLGALRRRLLEFGTTTAAEIYTPGVPVSLQVLGAACAAQSPYRTYAIENTEVFVGAVADALRRVSTVDDPEAVATVLFSGMRGIIQDRVITGDADRNRRAVEILIDGLLGTR